MAVISIYCVCSVIRLAYFNVLEGKRQKEEDGANKYYHGLPITSMAVILPVLFLFRFVVTDFIFLIMLHIGLLATGILFIVDFPFRKPKNSTLAVIVLGVAIALGIMLQFSKYRPPAPKEDTNPIIEQIIGEDT